MPPSTSPIFGVGDWVAWNRPAGGATDSATVVGRVVAVVPSGRRHEDYIPASMEPGSYGNMVIGGVRDGVSYLVLVPPREPGCLPRLHWPWTWKLRSTEAPITNPVDVVEES